MDGSRAVHVSRAQLVFYCLIAVLALLGLADSCYLTVMHLSGQDIACGPAGDCSTVLSSAYASVRGVPTAAFGAAAYFAAFSFALLVAFAYGWARILLVLLVAVMFIASLGLVCVQAFVLHAFCPFCLLSAAITFLITGLVLAAPRSA
jgi:uncharacterized membrane protein